jgi:RimJ/RimL family protein N-acetyltransferase
MTRIGNLETERLLIRPFTMDDLDPAAIEADRRMHEWRVSNEEMLARLDQPPYGDRAVALRKTGELIGAVGFVPYIDAFNIMPGLRYFSGRSGDDGSIPCATAEVGLFWAIDPTYQGKGYATEAAKAMINYAFNMMHLVRVIATTGFDNFASQAVMRKLGMQLHRNENGQPPWLQVVGVLENTKS